MDSGKFSTGSGTVRNIRACEYLTYIKQSFASVKGQSLHVVIDCGNGAAGLVAQAGDGTIGVSRDRAVLRGRWTIPESSSRPHGRGESGGSDSQPSKKQARMSGIGYDGDADRIGAVDEQGNILWGDRLMVVYLPRYPGEPTRQYDSVRGQGFPESL